MLFTAKYKLFLHRETFKKGSGGMISETVKI